MWLNTNEEQTMSPFMDYVYKNENRNFRFEYDDGSEFVVSLYLYEFESDNGLNVSEDGYEEYWEMAFEIVEIVKDDSNKHSVGDKILVNYHTVPKIYKVND